MENNHLDRSDANSGDRDGPFPEESQSRGWFSRGYLPHHDNESCIQHVTFHLADSLPKDVIERIASTLSNLPESRREAELRERVDAWIDAGHGSCVLADPEIAAMTQAAILHFDEVRYRLHAWVVMPNHVHVMFQPLRHWSLAKIVASWKKFTGRRIADRRCARSSGPACSPTPVWHREFWDRYIRDERHYRRVLEYIHQNPVAAGLVTDPAHWRWSSASVHGK